MHQITSPPASEPFDLRQLDATRTELAARLYEQHGFLVLSGLEKTVTAALRTEVGRIIGRDGAALERELAAAEGDFNFSRDVRGQLSRIATSPELAGRLLSTLRPLLGHLLGPLVHVSSSFHAQFKGASAARHAVDHGGYPESFDFMELHGAYLLHQDFAGAAIPTTPSIMTLWVGLNCCPDWTLRVYPGSHRLGLICDRWLATDDPRLAELGEPVDVPARLGTAVLFHGLTVHGSSNPGPHRRVSCDIRFFPLCGFLPTQPHFLVERPLEALVSAENSDGPTLVSAREEARFYLGQPIERREAEPLSVLNWLQMIAALGDGERGAARAHLARMTNERLGTGTVESYAARFLSRPFALDMLAELRERLAAAEPAHPALARFDEHRRQLAAAAERMGSNG